jgi:general secretion pathway protein J
VRQRGFTLIEILIAVLILGIVMTTVYASYTGTFRIIADTKTDAELYGMARTALERMTRDMESITPWKGAFSFAAKQSFLHDQNFTGLTFRSAAHVAFGKEDQAGGVAVIEYLVEETGERGGLALYRSDSLGRDLGEDAPPPRKYMVCDRIAGLTCRFYDDNGGDYETWDSEGGGDKQKKKAPTIVEIRMSLINDKNPDNPYPFMTRVYLPVTVVK